MLNAPPSGVDATVDVALLLGLVAGLRDDAERPTATMPFADAVTDLRAAVRHGPGARPRWPGIAGDARPCDRPAVRLIGVDSDVIGARGPTGSESGPALDVIAGRAREGHDGATWQLATLAHEERHHDRATALHRMSLRYRAPGEEGGPVRRWPVPSAPPVVPVTSPT